MRCRTRSPSQCGGRKAAVSGILFSFSSLRLFIFLYPRTTCADTLCAYAYRTIIRSIPDSKILFKFNVFLRYRQMLIFELPNGCFPCIPSPSRRGYFRPQFVVILFGRFFKLLFRDSCSPLRQQCERVNLDRARHLKFIKPLKISLCKRW